MLSNIQHVVSWFVRTPHLSIGYLNPCLLLQSWIPWGTVFFLWHFYNIWHRMAHGLAFPWVLYEFKPATVINNAAVKQWRLGSDFSSPCCRSRPLNWKRSIAAQLLVGSDARMSAVCWLGEMLQHHLLEVLGVTVLTDYKEILDHAAVLTAVPPRCSLWSLAVASLLFESQNFQGSVWGLQTRLWLVSLTFLRKHCRFLAIYPPEHLSRERKRDGMVFHFAGVHETTKWGCLQQPGFKTHWRNMLQCKKVKKFVARWKSEIQSELAKGICPTKCFPGAAQCSLCSNWTPLAGIS